MLRIEGAIQKYQWGTEGLQGEVGSLYQASGNIVERNQPYAELWMGTHNSGPALLKNQKDKTLLEWINANNQLLGLYQLPYLLKVLSVRKALSIQSHPNKRTAEELHRRFPQLYKDDNHKPEMAVALTDFTALCSFCPEDEIQQIPSTYPELSGCIKHFDNLKKVNKSNTKYLKECFSELIYASNESVKSTIQQIIYRIEFKISQSLQVSDKDRLILKLQEQYPYDVGVLVAPFLNLVQLKPGQAMYLEADQPHAYIYGDIVECMATSDNVIRAGLTPKHIDKHTLVETLTYTLGKPHLLEGDQINQYTKLYQPPFEEFEIHKLDLPENKKESVSKINSPQIWFVQQGVGNIVCSNNQKQTQDLEYNLSIKRGDILFVPPNTDAQLRTSGTKLTIWGASINQQAISKINIVQKNDGAHKKQKTQHKNSYKLDSGYAVA